MILFLGYSLLVLGAFVSLLNFYLSFLRVPLLRLSDRNAAVRNVSGFPIVGSAALWASLTLLHHSPPLVILAIAISLLDTGGVHWFLAVLIWARIRGLD